MVHAGIEENLTVLSYLFPLKFRTANFGKWWNDFSTNQSTTHIFKLKWSSNMMSALTLSKCNSVALIANRIFRRLKLQTIERICATEDLKISAVVQHRQINKKMRSPCFKQIAFIGAPTFLPCVKVSEVIFAFCRLGDPSCGSAWSNF